MRTEKASEGRRRCRGEESEVFACDRIHNSRMFKSRITFFLSLEKQRKVWGKSACVSATSITFLTCECFVLIFFHSDLAKPLEAIKRLLTLLQYRIVVKTSKKMASRRDFLSQQAPENYVAGLGRGATGFTTRSDLGPAREGPSAEQIQEALAKRAAQLGAAPPTAYGAAGKKPDEPEEDDERFQDPDNETGLFAFGQYDRDDDEADRIYQEVEEKMERRRKAQRLVHSLPPTLALCQRSLWFIFSTPG